MRVGIRDKNALLAVSPAAVSAYAAACGWKRQDTYRRHSDVYTRDGQPEIIVPRTERLGDYASVVATLIDTFARVSEQDELTVYRDLVTADRDVIRVRPSESEGGSINLEAGIDLLGGARDLVLSAACSLHEPQAAYRAGANKEAAELSKQLRLGPTDQDSFVVTLLTPVLQSPIQAFSLGPHEQGGPIARRMTTRLVEALTAARQAVERAAAGDDASFDRTVARGVSANLCEALVRLIKPFSMVDVGVSWARTWPKEKPHTVIRFGQSHTDFLHEAARLLRERVPQPDVRLHGWVRLLQGGEDEVDGTIRLVTDIERQRQSVVAVLGQVDYARAVQAHREKALVVLTGDLERRGQRCRLLSPHLEGVISNEDPGEQLRSSAGEAVRSRP